MIPGFSPKNLGYFQNIFFSIEMIIKLKSTLYFDFCFQSLFDLEIAIEVRQVRKCFIKLPTYNTIIILFCYIVFVLKFSLSFEGSCLFEGLNLLDKEKISVQTLFNTSNFKGLNLLDKEKISVQTLFNTSNQNNSAINSYLHTETLYCIPSYQIRIVLYLTLWIYHIFDKDNIFQHFNLCQIRRRAEVFIVPIFSRSQN